MMEQNRFHIRLYIITSIVIISAIISFSIVFKQDVGIMLCLLPLIAWIGFHDKKYGLYLFLFMMPFLGMSLLSENLMGIRGAKPFNLLAGFTLILFFFHGGSLFKHDDVIEKKSMVFLMIYFALFTFAMFRSLGYLKTLTMIDPDNFHSTPLRYLLSAYVRPALLLIPFIYILKHIKTEKDIRKCIDIICYSILILSTAIVIVGFLNFTVITSGRGATNEIIASFFGMHYNSVGSIYIIVIPLLVWQLVDGKRMAAPNYILSIAAVTLLQSRTAIMVVLGGTILLLYFFKKTRLIIVFIGLAALFVMYWLPEFLEKTLTTGFASRDLNSIFTGRIELMWAPLLIERLSDPHQLFFGVGRYSMMISPLYLKGYIYQATHAHNAFIDFFIDNGLIIFSGFTFYLVFFLRKAWRCAKKFNSPLAWALLTCMFTYLVGTVTGRSIYPHNENMHLFPIIALYINFIRQINTKPLPE